MFTKIITALTLAVTFATSAVAGNPAGPAGGTPAAQAALVEFDTQMSGGFTVECLSEIRKVKFVRKGSGQCPIIFISDELAAWAKQPKGSSGDVLACDPRNRKWTAVPIKVSKDIFTGRTSAYVRPWDKSTSERRVAALQAQWQKRGWGSFPTCN